MKKSGLFLVGWMLFSLSCGKDDPPPITIHTRYKEAVYVNVTSITDITYGSNVTANGANKTLKLDFYSPANDTAVSRPLLILLPGGGFGPATDKQAYLVPEAEAIPMPAGMSVGECFPTSSKKEKLLNYGLQYVPNVSGTLTSYTTGFIVSCTSHGSPIAKNQSCEMVNNVRMVNSCDNLHKVLINSSGNSGSSVRNKVEAGVPIILHQVWLTIPDGESITIEEDQLTDLTTSIDVSSGVYVTEYPLFAKTTVKSLVADVSRPVVFLDFEGNRVGDFISQLDWTISDPEKEVSFVIERSIDGKIFSQIGATAEGEKAGHFSTYQFLDKQAVEGDNYYRLMHANADGKKEYSPVRKVNFSAVPFSVSFTPNPADDFIQLDVHSITGIQDIRLLNVAGQVVMDEKNDNKNFNTRLGVRKLNAGIYTLIVETNTDKYSYQVVIAH